MLINHGFERQAKMMSAIRSAGKTFLKGEKSVLPLFLRSGNLRMPARGPVLGTEHVVLGASYVFERCSW